MSSFSGPQPGWKGSGKVKGCMSGLRSAKRGEAEARNLASLVQNRAIFRRSPVELQQKLLEAQETGGNSLSPDIMRAVIKEFRYGPD